MSQTNFASLAYQSKRKTTRRERFFSEMEEIVPWQELEELIRPYYAKGPGPQGGRPPVPLQRMLRIRFVQLWENYSDPAMEDALNDIDPIRHFVGIVLGEDPIPDETTILNFRELLRVNGLADQIFAVVNAHLQSRGLLLREGTTVDATIIEAPASTKNQSFQRDPEMRSTFKNRKPYFGFKAHIGADSDSGLVHTVVVTPANVHDSKVTGELLHGQETKLYGDKAYNDQARQKEFERSGGEWLVQHKAKRGTPLTPEQEEENYQRSRVRNRVEHPFRYAKQVFKFRKTRFRGLEKNRSHMVLLFALSNLYMAKDKLLAWIDNNAPTLCPDSAQVATVQRC